MKREQNAAAKILLLKKKLFTLAAYLVVTAALLLYVSYSSYRIQVDGTVVFPQVGMMAASIALNPDLEDVRGNVADASFIVDMMPGDSTSTFASEDNSAHKMTLSVTNSMDEGVTACDVDLTYHIVLEGEGNLMLDLMLKDTETQTLYVSKRTGEYGDYEYRFYPSSTSETEAEFQISGGTVVTKTYYIYVGWDNGERDSRQSGQSWVTTTNADQLENGRYRKEVEDLKISAELVGGDPGHDTYPAAPEVINPGLGG